MRADLESLRAYLDNIKQKYIEPLERGLDQLESIAKGAQSAKSFDDYSSMINELNHAEKSSLAVGLNILIVTLNVPDLWVSEVLEESVPYIYVSDQYLVDELAVDGKVQVGHFVLSPLETLKCNLVDYVKNTDYATTNTAGVTIAADGSALMNERKGNNGELPYVPSTNLSFAVKRGLINGKASWVDEEKAVACETIGAVAQSQPARGVRLYGSNNVKQTYYDLTKNGVLSLEANNIVTTEIATNEAKPYSMVKRSVLGVIYAGTPTENGHATTKKYVDDLIAELRVEIEALKNS